MFMVNNHLTCYTVCYSVDNIHGVLFYIHYIVDIHATYTMLLIYNHVWIFFFLQGQVLEALNSYKLSNSTVIHMSYVTPREGEEA